MYQMFFKRVKNIIYVFALSLMMAVCFFVCLCAEVYAMNGAKADAGEAITLDVQSITLGTKGVGSSMKLFPSVSGSSKKVSWMSSDMNVATVKNGMVKAKGCGSAVITAAANGSVSSCKVTVSDNGVYLSKEKITLYLTPDGKYMSQKLKSSDKNKSCRLRSSNDSVAVVDEKGNVRAVSAGICSIFVEDAEKVYDSCIVEVKNCNITLWDEKVSLHTTGYDKTYNISYTLTAPGEKLKWKSSNSKVVTVKKGMLKAKSTGEAVITVTGYGETAVCKVSVNMDEQPSEVPSDIPSEVPSKTPSEAPSEVPSDVPSKTPSEAPSEVPSKTPSEAPSEVPSKTPSEAPSDVPGEKPSEVPSDVPGEKPSEVPSETPSDVPSEVPGDTPGGSESCEHYWKDWEITIAPTEDKEGKRERSCYSCGKKEQAVIPRIPAKTTIMQKIRARLDENNINAISKKVMPSKGDVKALVLYIDFKNKDTWVRTKEEIDARFFDTNETRPNMMNHSLHTFFKYESGGRLNFTGETIAYTTKKASNEYESENEIIREALDDIFSKTDIRQFDSNGDGYFDALYFMTTTRDYPDSTTAGAAVYLGDIYEDKETGIKVCQAMHTSNGNDLGVDTLAHESMHMMGLPDIYGGVGVNYDGTHSDSIMDGSMTTVPGPMKFFLGWYDELIEISDIGDTDIEQRAITGYKTGDIAVIYPNGNKDSRFVYLLEFLDKEGLFESVDYLDNGGLRVWRMLLSIDDAYYIKGNDSRAGNSPYEYLDTISFDAKAYKYSKVLGEGESVTPYTYPSTAYGLEYIMRNQKSIKRWLFSGISIDNISVETGRDGRKTARYRVGIEKESSKTTADFKYEPVTGGFLLADDEGDIAVLRITGDLDFVKGDGRSCAKIKEQEYPLTAKIRNNGRYAELCINSADYESFKESDDALLVVEADTVRSSYGASNERIEIDMKEDAGAVKSFEEKGEKYYYDNPYASILLNVYMPFALSDDVAATINRNAGSNGVYKDCAYIMTTYNVSTHKVEQKKLVSAIDDIVSGKDVREQNEVLDTHPLNGVFGIWTRINTDEGTLVTYDCYDADGNNVESRETTWEEYLEHMDVYQESFDSGANMRYPMSGDKIVKLENKGTGLYFNEYEKRGVKYSLSKENLILDDISIKEGSNIFFTHIQECENGYMLNYQAECPDSFYSNAYSIYAEWEENGETHEKTLVAKKLYHYGKSSWIYNGKVVRLGEGRYVLITTDFFQELE